MAKSGLGASIQAFVQDIKLEHSLFALPFALLGMLLAASHEVALGRRAGVLPTAAELVLILVAMVGARSAAMGFNRVVDRRLDARNPRTARRPLAAGQARLGVYLGLSGLGLALLFVAAGLLNPLALQLAPLAVVVLFGYSLTKRFTALCHYFVGLALAIAPLAAWVAIAGRVPAQPGPYLLALAVVFWVGGFDIVYATMDIDFDRAAGVFSLPARFGIERSLGLARLSHLAMVACLLGVGLTTPALGRGFGLGTVAAAAILAYEHAIVRPDDLRRVNMAFFTLNGVLGILLLVAGALDLL